MAPKGMRATVTVKQVFPACVGVGHFTLHAHAGVNSFLFADRISGRPLQPGTYHVTVRSTRSGRLLRRIVLVVVSDASPSARQLAALRGANVCSAAAAGTSSTSSAAIGAGTGTSLHGSVSNQHGDAAALVPTPHGVNFHSGVLGSSVEQTARAIKPLLVALLAFAIVLLGVASLPREAVPDARLHDALARHRLELAALGGAALVAVALAFLLS